MNEPYICRWRGKWIILQLQADQRRHLAHLRGQFANPVAADVQRDQLQVGDLARNVHQLVVAEEKGSQLSQLHHAIRQTGDLVAGCVQLGQFVHAAEFVGQLQEAVVGDQEDLQWQEA